MVDEQRTGVFFGLAAYVMWGFFPLFFKQVANVSATEVLAHRIFWSALFLIGLILLKRQGQQLLALFQQPRTLIQMIATTLLISVNWLVFIYAVAAGYVLQSSLGYFIGPLVSTLLGFFFLQERLNRLQVCSLVLASLGVSYLTLLQGGFPWIAMSLAFSFALYGLLRKKAGVGPTLGLALETSLLTPIALIYMLILKYGGILQFGEGTNADFWLPLSGIVTALPLIWFNAAAKRLRLVTIGFLQYITPTLHFILAIFLFSEPFDSHRLIGFSFVWGGLLLYSLNAFMQISGRSRNLPI